MAAEQKDAADNGQQAQQTDPNKIVLNASRRQMPHGEGTQADNARCQKHDSDNCDGERPFVHEITLE